MDSIDDPANVQVLAYLKQKSSPNLLARIAPQSAIAYTDHTHPELGDLLQAACKDLPGRRMSHMFGFLVLVNSGGVICALAESTSTLAFRLPEESRSGALQAGAQAMENIGKDWVAFNPWKQRVTDQERVAVFQMWCERACGSSQGDA